MKNIKNHKAFTLAEVLITLAIIGVIAAISVPSLIQKTNSAELKVAYKKAFAVASQAYDKANYDGTMVNRPDWGDLTTNLKNFNTFKSYFKVVKDCNSANNSNCWDNTGDKYWTVYPQETAPAFIDSSGVAWSKNTGDATGVGDELLVDTNGFKGPNKFGKDRWLFSPLVDANVASNTPGIPSILTVRGDCVSSTDCPTSAPSYAHICPSPPCYFTSWLSGKDN